jgi:hypothetical protein
MAVNDVDALTCSVEMVGETDTTMAGTVILDDAVLLGSEANAAVTTTVRSVAGAAAGAE